MQRKFGAARSSEPWKLKHGARSRGAVLIVVDVVRRPWTLKHGGQSLLIPVDVVDMTSRPCSLKHVDQCLDVVLVADHATKS